VLRPYNARVSSHLSGKRVLILGAETEIGRAVTTAVAEAGASVAAVAATSDAEAAFAVQRLARRLSAGGRKVIAQAIDATNDAAVRVMVRQVSKELGGLDAVVYCQLPLKQLTREEVEGKSKYEIDRFMEERMKQYGDMIEPIVHYVLQHGGRELDRMGGGPLITVDGPFALYGPRDAPRHKWWLERVPSSDELEKVVKRVLRAVKSHGWWWKAAQITPRPLLPVYRFLARVLIKDR